MCCVTQYGAENDEEQGVGYPRVLPTLRHIASRVNDAAHLLVVAYLLMGTLLYPAHPNFGRRLR